MSERYKIIEYMNRLREIYFPYTVASAIIMEDGNSLAYHIDYLYRIINSIYYIRGEDNTVSSGFPENGDYELEELPKNSTVNIAGTVANIITTKDRNGVINFPRTMASAVIMPDNLSLQDKLDGLTQEIIKLDELVNPLAVKNFRVNGSSNLILELGASLSTLVFTWNYNKDVKKQTLTNKDLNISEDISVNSFTYKDDDANLDDLLRIKYYSYSLDTSLTSRTQKSFTFRLDAVSKYDGKASGSVNVSFYNSIYFGAHTDPNGANNIVSSLSKKLVANKYTQVTADGGTDKYIYIMIPVRFGSVAFKDPITGFFGGFMYLSTIDITNSYGVTETYNVYRSDNYGLGNTTVELTNPS